MDGESFGRYRLQELLGRGGMGEVWRAYDTATNRVVALKLLPAHLADDDTFVRRFRREAEAAAQLNNAHVIPIHSYGEIDGRLYVDMRLIEGRDLAEVLSAGPLEPERAVRIIAEAARALHAAHKIGLVHRDVKPSNLLLDEDDFAYLIDFGIARGTDQTKLTDTGATIGTWAYMAPERFSAGEVDARADIYALACVLYECLTGNPPFPGETVESQVAAHLSSSPPRPSKARPGLSERFDSVVQKGMAKDPEKRYATTVELAREAGDAATAPLPIQPPTQLAPHHGHAAAASSPTHSVLVVALSASVVVALVVFLLGYFAFSKRPSPQTNHPTSSSGTPTMTSSQATLTTSVATTTTASIEIGNTINYGSMGTTADLDCESGKSLNVGGSNNTLTVKGTCSKVSIGGADNKITFDTIDKEIDVVGFNNTVTYKNGNPKVENLGEGNTINTG